MILGVLGSSIELERAPDFARRTAATGQVVGSDVEYLEDGVRFASAAAVSVSVVTGYRLSTDISHSCVASVTPIH